MKLYTEYKNAVEKLGKIEKAYFTTFNLDISFVEKYILPPLFKEDIPDNKFSLEDLNLSIMKNKFDIKIFHDVNMLTTFEKKTLIQTYPILINGGVFHPKVIYLKGSKSTYLFVGSGNLTLNGWGRNIEAFDITNITEIKSLENQVLNFYDDVFELAGINRQNKTYRKVQNNDQNFIYNFCKYKDNNSHLLEALNIDKWLQIFSPYFSNNLDELFKRNEFKSLESIDIIPDLIENQKIRLKTLPTIDKRIKFYRFNKIQINDDNADSINHSKIWLTENNYAIGSHNCTEAALYGNNFEASIVKSYKNKNEFSIDNFINVDNLITTEDNISIEDELDEEQQFSTLYKLVANYNDYTLQLDIIHSSNCSKNKILIKLPSFKDVTIRYNELVNLEYSKRILIFRALTKNKIYEVYNENNKLIFRGIIVEINASIQTRIADSAETLEDIFLAFSDAKNPTEAKHLENRNINIDRDEEFEYRRKHKQININYFNMFNGFQNLTKKYEQIKNDQEKLERFCFLSSASLLVVKNIIESKLTDENLFIYLTVLEFNKLISKRNIKHIGKIVEPQITLSADDKKFIKDML